LELIRSIFNLIILKSFYDRTRSQDEFHVANHLRYSSSRSMELQLGIGIS